MDRIARALLIVGLVPLLGAARSAAAAEQHDALALVVGTDRGGPGQSDLRFAEDDARHVAELLGTLGRYQPGRVELMLRPSLRQLQGGLDRLAARRRGAPAGERAAGPLLLFRARARERAQPR